MTQVRIQLFGEFRIFLGDQLQHRGPQTRQQGLFAYLLVHRPTALHRHQVAAEFWPDSGKDQALSNLRTALTRLQQDLPWLPRFWEHNQPGLDENTQGNLQVDVLEFEWAWQQAEKAAQANDATGVICALRRAVALYVGDFLPHLYDEWVLAEQERLRNLYLEALEWLITLLQEQDDYGAAIRYAQQLASVDPLSESACRHLIKLHAQHGDRASAVRVYRAFARRLHQELGVDPSPATQALYEQIISDDPLAHAVPSRQRSVLLPRFVQTWRQQNGAVPLAGSNLAGWLKLTALLIEQGCWAEAESLLQPLEPHTLGTVEWGWAAEILRLRGLLAWRRGDPAGLVESQLQRAVTTAQAEQAPLFLLHAAVTLVCHRQAQNPAADPLAQLAALSRELRPFCQAFSWQELQSLCKVLG